MEIKHYATFYTNKNLLPSEKTLSLDSNDIKVIDIPKDVYRVVTFDRLVGEMEFQGTTYPVATKRINQKLYHIGKFELIDNLKNQDPHFVELAKKQECVGMVTSSNGLETLVFKGEGIVDPYMKNKILQESNVISSLVYEENVDTNNSEDEFEEKNTFTTDNGKEDKNI